MTEFLGEIVTVESFLQPHSPEETILEEPLELHSPKAIEEMAIFTLNAIRTWETEEVKIIASIAIHSPLSSEDILLIPVKAVKVAEDILPAFTILIHLPLSSEDILLPAFTILIHLPLSSEDILLIPVKAVKVAEDLGIVEIIEIHVPKGLETLFDIPLVKVIIAKNFPEYFVLRTKAKDFISKIG
jgi:hypothetical protein